MPILNIYGLSQEPIDKIRHPGVLHLGRLKEKISLKNLAIKNALAYFAASVSDAWREVM
jgi:hypothetical protein